MKILYCIVFLFIANFSYSQFGKDSLLNFQNLSKHIQPDKDSTSKASDKTKSTTDLNKKLSISNWKLDTKKDSLFSKKQTKLNTLIPKHTNFLTKQLKALKPKGNISIGYEYGVLPFVAGDNYPSGGFKTEGKVSFLIIKIPLEFTYYYTNIKNVIGLNNYFRLSFDAERYKEQLNEKISVKDELDKNKLVKLQLEQKELLQKLEFLNFLKQNPNYNIPQRNNINKSISQNLIPEKKIDSLLLLKQNPNHTDSISLSTKDTSKVTSLKNKELKSLNNIDKSSGLDKDTANTSPIKSNNSLHKKDSISRELINCKSKYDSINKEIASVKKEIDLIKNPESKYSKYTSPYLSKSERILNNIKKFEIGLCHPTYSTFLVNNIPLKGINIEYGEKNNFFAFTYGTTVNYLLYNTNNIQNTIQGQRNLFNYFDFADLSSGRKVLSFKGGIGAKDDSHIYVGFMLGKGRTDYLLVDNSSSTSKESNLVLELDAKYKIAKGTSLDFILGKSSIQEEDISMEQIMKSINEIFSNYRSYAFLSRFNSEIKKTKTKLTFTVRWVDPFFNSYGLGFLRSDNLRYEIKAEQPITKKIKYTIMYRKEEDNILKLYDYKNTIQTINNSLNIKLSRQLNIRLIYAPLFRELNDNTNKTIIKDRNNISTVILSYTPKPKNVTLQFNLLYSRYLITGDSSNINFENLTYTTQVKFKSGFKTDVNVSWFKNNLKDTIGNNTYLGVLDVGYVAKNKNSFTIGGKMAVTTGLVPQFGYLAKASIKLYKGLFWEAEIQKIIIGEYYNSFMLGKIKTFPYYCNSKFVLNF